MISWLKQTASTIATAFVSLLDWRRRPKPYPGRVVKVVRTDVVAAQDKQSHRARRVRRREESIRVGEQVLRGTTARREINEAVEIIEDGTVTKTTIEW